MLGIKNTLVLSALVALPGLSAVSDQYKVTGSTKLANGTEMVFRLFVPPSYDGSQKHPIVLIMHGIEAVGNNNTSQLNSGLMGTPWIADSIQKKYAPFVLAPQCPSNLAWATNGSADQAGNGAVKILDSLKTVFALDTTRFYLAGYSWGGIGTWGLMKSFPGKFAAAVPCAGSASYSANSTQGAALARTPFFAFHGDADAIVSVSGSRNAVASAEGSGTKVLRFNAKTGMTAPTGIDLDSLSKAVTSGAPFIYYEITGGSHATGCTEAWRNKLMLPWLFSKAKVNGVAVAYSGHGVLAIAKRGETGFPRRGKGGQPAISWNYRRNGLIDFGVGQGMRTYSAKGSAVISSMVKP